MRPSDRCRAGHGEPAEPGPRRFPKSSWPRGHPDWPVDPDLDQSFLERATKRLHHKWAVSEGPDQPPVPALGGPVSTSPNPPSRSARVPGGLLAIGSSGTKKGKRMNKGSNGAATADRIGSSPADSPPWRCPLAFGGTASKLRNFRYLTRAKGWRPTSKRNDRIVRHPVWLADHYNGLADGRYRYAVSQLTSSTPGPADRSSCKPPTARPTRD